VVRLVFGNSGGIVGLGGPLHHRLDRRAPFGLGLAALEVFPQSRREAPLLPRLLGSLTAAPYPAAFAHQARLRPQPPSRKPAPTAPACAPSGLVAMIPGLCGLIIVVSRSVAGTLP
jgi:hypothetical protein